jgi:hypothetical protein
MLYRVHLLVQAGILALPPLTDFPPCPEDAIESVRKVFDGFRYLWALKQLVVEWAGEPTQFARGFAAVWCGVTPITAHRAREWLAKKEVISIVGRHKGVTCVYLPGYHRGSRQEGSRGRSREEIERVRREELACVRGIALRAGYRGPELTLETRISDRLLRFADKVRRSRKMTAAERNIFLYWVESLAGS